MAESVARRNKNGYAEINEVDNKGHNIDDTGVADHCRIVPRREHELRFQMTTEIRGYAPSLALRHYSWHPGILVIYHRSYNFRIPGHALEEQTPKTCPVC